MAIDTAERRRAVAALSGAHWFGPGVTPNAGTDKEWRQESGYGYPGIVPQGEIEVTGLPPHQGFLKNVGRTIG